MKLAMKLLLFLVVVLSLVGSASATDYFVKNGGSDSADGLSDTNAWETLAKVNGFSFNTGDDVYFKCGDEWALQTLTVDWSGTSENKVVIGAYYGAGTIGENGTRPIISGTLRVGDSDDLAGYPSNRYISLLTIAGEDYVTLQDMKVFESGGLSIQFNSGSSYIIVDNCIVASSHMHGILMYNVDTIEIDNCTIIDTARRALNTSNGGWPGGIVPHSGTRNLWCHNNILHSNNGETLITYDHANNLLIENNTFYQNTKAQILLTGAYDPDPSTTYNVTIRYNLIYGTNDTDYWRGGAPSKGIWINDASMYSVHNISIYNNLIANCNNGIFFSVANPVDDLRDVDIYNNIIIGGSYIFNFGGSGGTYSNINITNNIFSNWTTGASNLDFSADFDFDYNLWSSDPVYSGAYGANDPTYSNPLFAKTSGWADLPAGLTDGSEFVIQSGSYAINNGTDLGSPYDQGLNSTSTWVDNIILADQDDYGTGWEIGAFVYGTAAEGESAPTASDFGLYKIITINQTMVNQSIGTGIYPLLVSTTDTDLRDNAQTDGDDIVFFAGDNTTLLPYEQEFWNSTNGELVEWVGVEDIINETHIVMYYNNSTIANSENATGVWDSNFVVVQHLNETPAGTTYDSTSNNNDGTTVGMDSADQVAGQVDGSLDFDGADRISLTSPAIDNNAAFTISTWMYGEPDSIVYGEGYSVNTQWALFLGVEANPPYSARFYYKENNVWKALTTGTTQVNDTRHHVVLSQASKSSRTMYIDRVAEETDTDAVGDMSILDTANIGVLQRSDFASYFVGEIDELRISDIARSAEWIETEYNNTASPELFISIGAEQGEGAPDTKFEYWTGSAWGEGAAYYYLWFTCFWYTPECANAEQSSGQSTLKITNNGTASGTPKMKLNESAPSGIRIFVDDDNTFADAVELTNTYQAVSTSLNQDTNITLWAWANLSGAPAWEFETYAIVE